MMHSDSRRFRNRRTGGIIYDDTGTHSVRKVPFRGRRRKARGNRWLLFFFSVGVCVLGVLLCPFVLPPEVGAALRGKNEKATEQTVRESIPEARANVRWSDNIATVTGRGRVNEESAQGRALARRAALLDAQRNLLLLRERLLSDKSYEYRRRITVSGKIKASKIHSERRDGSFYLLELDIGLDDLMRQGCVENLTL